ncbi:BZ3500_MvSof-1268-A1-R1_Chr7-2g09497 [Microbotryum saponariae]|uniref:BZ3500_MvSof-1268-A1-R1_Chr7-2g09497 protein n=1 Tax=Microbotryum saponariae TaxID=289078 RepID=A0A2X0NBJ6_9BASI|nr:BZ3500_MvSof-1268-A1-R1_Chr7-2g09497 [Microbotryum saponariae]
MQHSNASEGDRLPLHQGRDYQGVPYYDQTEHRYGSGYTEKPTQKESRKKLCIIISVIILILAIVGGVVGGVLGSRKSHNNSSNSDSGSSSSGSGSSGGGSSPSLVNTASGGVNHGLLLPTSTDVLGNPLYPTATGSAVISAPTTINDSKVFCQADPYTFANTSSLAVRKEHPLLIAPAYKWDCVRNAIPNNYYLSFWNDTIFQNATKFYDLSPTNYTIDGGLGADAREPHFRLCCTRRDPEYHRGSGVLDVAREVQLRIKHWAYAYRMTNDTRWVNRTWTEVLTAAGNSTTGQYFGITGDNWNSIHFLDVGEFTAAFAIAYDWLYDAWTEEQRAAIRWSITNLGLSYGLNVYQDPDGAAESYSWWRLQPGNWDCVCTNGLIMGALAIANEDTTGIAAKVLAYATANSAEVCAMAVQADGTWTETPNYWYFGTTAHAEAASSLLSATGSTQGLLTSNPSQNLSSLYHMYVTGQKGLFDYGDTGPRKFTATANGLLFYGDQFDIPTYALFQRDRGDAPEPMAMFWYNPQTRGSWWDNLALDHHFPNATDDWASMRSSWTDNNGTYVAMKAGNLTGHQTHGDLDIGDFVMDALGQRWAGENGNGQYLANGYVRYSEQNAEDIFVLHQLMSKFSLPHQFTTEAQDGARWTYYQKGTQGQNTIMINEANQNVLAAPALVFDTTGEAQTALNYAVPSSSTAYMTVDMTATYNDTTSAKRAIRFLNKRQQILLRDEITTTGAILWRMQTNATVSITSNGTTATLTLGGQTMIANLRQPSNGTFTTVEAVRLSGEDSPSLASGNVDTPNGPIPGVTVLTVSLRAGTRTIEVLFNPQWSTLKASDYVDPPDMTIDKWTLTSHN